MIHTLPDNRHAKRVFSPGHTCPADRALGALKRVYHVYCSVTPATRFLADQLIRELTGNGFAVNRRDRSGGCGDDLSALQEAIREARVVLLLSSGNEMRELHHHELQLARCYERPILLFCLKSRIHVSLTLLGWQGEGKVSEGVVVGYEQAFTLVNRALWEARAAAEDEAIEVEEKFAEKTSLEQCLETLGPFQLATYSYGIPLPLAETLPYEYPLDFRGVLVSLFAAICPDLQHRNEVLSTAKAVWEDRHCFSEHQIGQKEEEIHAF